MAKQKAIDYILGMISEVSLMIAPWGEENAIQEVSNFSTKARNPYIWIL